MSKMWPIVTIPVVLVAWLVAVGIGKADLPVADQPLTTQGAGAAEVSFGDLAADALCQVSGASLAFAPAVSFREGTIPTGPFDAAAVSALLQKPEETWAVSRLTGRQIAAALERSVSRAPLPNGAFLQVAGLTVTYDPRGRKDARVKQILVAGAPLNETQTYEVAMPLSLAKGGAGYFQIFDASDILRQGNQAFGDVIFSFAAAAGHVSYTGQGRIIASR